MNTDRNEQIARLFQNEAAHVQNAAAAAARGVSQADIEDACSIAWTVLTRREDLDVTDPRIVNFLITVAAREAWRIARRQTERPTYDPQETTVTDTTDVLDIVIDRETLRLIDQLPERQQLVVRLRAQGLGYEDIAAITGWTGRTIDRQLGRARARLRTLRE